MSELCSIKKSWIANKRFHCMATSRGMRFRRICGSVALWLTPRSSLFSCQGCHTQYSGDEEHHDTLAYKKGKTQIPLHTGSLYEALDTVTRFGLSFVAASLHAAVKMSLYLKYYTSDYFIRWLLPLKNEGKMKTFLTFNFSMKISQKLFNFPVFTI